MIMWVMSDRAIPRSFRMMEGFGVHTFRFVNADGQVALREVPLEAAARRALAWCGTRRRRSPARTRTSTAATSGRRSRAATSRSGSSACRSSRRRTSTSSTSTCSTRPSSSPRSWCRCSAIGKLTLEPQPGQLLRRDRAGRLPRRATSCPGIDFTNDPLLQGAALLLPRHAAHAAGRAELPRDPDQPAGRAGAQQPARRPHAPDASTRAGSATSRTRSAAAARSRPAPTHGGFVQLPGARSTAQKIRAAQRELLRPLQPGDAVLQQPVRRRSSSTSSRRCGSSSARSSAPADPRARGGPDPREHRHGARHPRGPGRGRAARPRPSSRPRPTRSAPRPPPRPR